MVGGSTDYMESSLVSEFPNRSHHSTSSFPKLLSLNLYKNKLYQLDDLSEIMQMVPTVKNLNLSKNKVRRRTDQSCVGS